TIVLGMISGLGMRRHRLARPNPWSEVLWCGRPAGFAPCRRDARTTRQVECRRCRCRFPQQFGGWSVLRAGSGAGDRHGESRFRGRDVPLVVPLIPPIEVDSITEG